MGIKWLGVERPGPGTSGPRNALIPRRPFYFRKNPRGRASGGNHRQGRDLRLQILRVRRAPGLLLPPWQWRLCAGLEGLELGRVLFHGGADAIFVSGSAVGSYRRCRTGHSGFRNCYRVAYRRMSRIPLRLLMEFGRALALPHSSKVVTSRHAQMRELRTQSAGRPLRTCEVSKIEHRHDICISTLADYIEAMGGRLEIRAVFKDLSVRITQFEKLAS
jgi:hypothetical protein